MKYIVTGGAGFIGSNLVDKLLVLGHKVIVIDDFSAGKEENLINHKNNQNLVIYKKSICDNLVEIFKENKEIRAVFHLAALPRVQFSIKEPKKTHDINVNGTLNLLHFCKEFGIKRFIFASSSAVYGNLEKLPFTEDTTPDPVSPYALQKLVGEYYCKLFNKLYGLETISLRYFNVFGPRQNPEEEYSLLIPKFIKLIYKGIKPTIHGDGEQTRDFIFVSDVIEASILAANTKNNHCFGQIFNIGSGRNISVNEVTKSIIKLINRNIEPIYGPPVIEPKHNLANIEKAKELIKWKPRISFEGGLNKTTEYFIKN